MRRARLAAVLPALLPAVALAAGPSAAQARDRVITLGAPLFRTVVPFLGRIG